MNALMTSRGGQVNTAVLTRLAERWRPAGLFLACIDRDGNLLWHDSQMPRILALCFTADNSLAVQVRALTAGAETVAPAATSVQTTLPWIRVQLIPIARRRKVSGWIAAIGRTDNISSGNEDLARIAQRASLDAQALIAQAQRIPLIPAPLFASLARLVEQMHEDLHGSAVTGDELANVTEQLSSVYEELSLLYKISSGMRFSQRPQAFLETVCREVQGIGNYRTVIVALAAENEKKEIVVSPAPVVVGQCAVDPEALLKTLDDPIRDALSIGDAQVHNDIHADAPWAALGSSIKRFVCVPLQRDHRALGVMIAIDKQDASGFNSVDLKLLNNVGSQCSIFLENAALYQDMQDLFMGVLHALTRSIDAKDTYTRGHSQRVAELSRDLARRIGLSDEQCERVYLSGLLHDVGKIGVPETVLTKPGRLTDAEFEAIKKHPAIGAQILNNIKQLADIIPGVLYHHERWDGRGYPHQIAGEEIPLMGRIIAVADSFDAMSSTRTYRPALPLESVLEEIGRCAGKQFDPALAKVFVTLDFEPYRRAVDEQFAFARTSNGTPSLAQGASA